VQSPRPARRQWRDAQRGHIGPGVARLVRRARGSDGGCAGQAFMNRGLPVGSSDGEAATDGGAEEFIDGGGTPMAPGGGDDLMQQWDRGGCSEVRPGRAKGATWVELIEMAEGSVSRFRNAVRGNDDRFRNAVRGGGSSITGADERPRGERGGSRELLARRSGAGEEKGTRWRSSFF
jgi:hypothetical protein